MVKETENELKELVIIIQIKRHLLEKILFYENKLKSIKGTLNSELYIKTMESKINAYYEILEYLNLIPIDVKVRSGKGRK